MSESSKAHLFNDSKLLACLTQTALCECMKADSCKRATTEPKLYIPSTYYKHLKEGAQKIHLRR